jgi:hypothetical protein
MWMGPKLPKKWFDAFEAVVVFYEAYLTAGEPAR